MRSLFAFAFVGLVAVSCAQPTTFDEDSGTPLPDAGKSEGGTCMGSQIKCGSTCTDTTKDLSNCGACGKKCTATQFCASSKCSDTCPSPSKICGQFCVDVNTDHDNCGGCGKPCKGNEDCKAGMCQIKCPANLSVCDMTCVDTTSDSNYCGDCMTACAMNEHCTGSICCASTLTSCNGTCTDTNGDSNNCGACGFACGGNTPYCTNGTCGILNHGTSQLTTDYTSSGGCGDFSVWRTQNFGQMTFDNCEKLANQYGAMLVGAPTLYAYNAPYAAYVRWVGEASNTNGYVSTNIWNSVTSVAKNTSQYCVLGYANGTQHGMGQFNQAMTSSNGKTYYVHDYGVISEMTCYTNALAAGARTLNPQLFGLNLGATHMVENHSCHGSVEYNGNSFTSDGGAPHNYRCFIGYN
jgi:hypothetical protein